MSTSFDMSTSFGMSTSFDMSTSFGRSKVTVIGLDGSPLTELAAQRLGNATLVVGGARHLESQPIPAGAEKVVLGDVTAGLEAIATHPGHAVVLASGDPGFFGIVRLLRERGIEPEIFPGVSSIATLCARAGVTWDDAIVVSAHGRGDAGLRRAVNACRAHSKVAVLTARGTGPAELGTALAGIRRRMVIGENLGGSDENVTSCCPEDAAGRSWAEPNVALVLGERPPASTRGWAHPARRTPISWALEEAAFEHRDGMVTKAEVRAIAFARLAPGIGDLIWDIGAGCGAVAVECARFGAAVSAVDSDDAQCERIARNAAGFGVEVEVVHGEAPKALDGLAAPDGVFIGGGGSAVTTIVTAAARRKPRAIVVALAAVERVGPVSQALRQAEYATGGVQLSAARLTPLPGEVTRLAAQNPVFLLWGELLPDVR